MKTSFKFFLPLCALSLIVSPLVRAADETPSVQTPIPAAPDAGSDIAPVKGKGPRGGRGGQMMENIKALKDKLNLTPDQETKIGAIIKSHADEFKTIRENKDRAKGMELLKTQHGEINAVLTPDQQKIYAESSPMGRAHGKGKNKKDDATP